MASLKSLASPFGNNMGWGQPKTNFSADTFGTPAPDGGMQTQGSPSGGSMYKPMTGGVGPMPPMSSPFSWSNPQAGQSTVGGITNPTLPSGTQNFGGYHGIGGGNHQGDGPWNSYGLSPFQIQGTAGAQNLQNAHLAFTNAQQAYNSSLPRPNNGGFMDPSQHPGVTLTPEQQAYLDNYNQQLAAGKAQQAMTQQAFGGVNNDRMGTNAGNQWASSWTGGQPEWAQLQSGYQSDPNGIAGMQFQALNSYFENQRRNGIAPPDWWTQATQQQYGQQRTA